MVVSSGTSGFGTGKYSHVTRGALASRFGD